MSQPSAIGDLLGSSSRLEDANVYGRVEEGAAAGYAIRVAPHQLFGVGCKECGGQALYGKDGRLQITHNWARHGGVMTVAPKAARPVRPVFGDDD